ncbi:hypothetical protein SETIT_9G275700v2 [Setaria italica]|uniref:Uncharacterized protein n=1 Tax=Setaria italica TaxID=4555 RepID=A0A368SL84_SETIT|nr:hypothetical protein SETIT_9G275700v2 [Setaria italica]
MRSLPHISNPAARKHCSTSRCIVPAVLLLLLAAALATSNVYFTFPSRVRVPFPRPFSSRITRRGEGCDIFRGDWVPDPDAPYYTNDTCSVIHEHYNCMRYGKPDLGFVKWRWRPDGCDLPRFNPWRFLDMMKGKSIAFVGDSLARNHKDSLICLLTRAAEPTPSWPSSKHTVYYYGEYNFTVANFWAPYLVRHEQIDEDGPAHTGLWNLFLDEPDAVWAAHVAEFDYAVVSASSWFYRPSMLYEAGGLVGCHYCLLPNVTDLTPRYALRMATRAALRALSGADGRFRGTAVLRTVDPSQYEGGEWNRRELRPDQAVPARGEEGRGLRARFPQPAAGRICGGGEGGDGRRRQGKDDADGHDGGDDTARRRAPEQVPGLDAGEALHLVQRLRPLVPARGPRYLERYASLHVEVCMNSSRRMSFECSCVYCNY